MGAQTLCNITDMATFKKINLDLILILLSVQAVRGKV